MNKRRLSSLLAFCLLGAAMLPAARAQEIAPSTKEEQKKKPDEIFVGMKDFNPLLSQNLFEKFSQTDPARLAQVLKSKKVQLSLNAWKVTNAVKRETFIRIARTPNGFTFLCRFLRDAEWMDHFLNSGPFENPDLTLSHLAAIYEIDFGLEEKPVHKKLATATALEFGRNGWSEKDCVARYEFYKGSYDYKLLNPVFETLDYWDMRIVAGCKNDNTWGSVKNLTWMRDNVRLTINQYCGAAYQVPYRLENYFGDSIHGSDYYRCFNNIYDTQAEMSREIGAVCGGLSHYGAFAALGNGVPALTMGEPGHCAYTVRVNGVWQPCNSVFAFKRGAHWNFYGTEWSMLFLTQEFMSQKEQLQTAGRYDRLGDLFASSGDIPRARASYVLGLKTQPMNIALWRKYLEWEAGNKQFTTQEWSSINDSICKYFAERYPEIALKTLNQYVYPNLMPLMDNVHKKIGELQKYHKIVRKQGPLKWDVTKYLDAQFTSLGDPQALPEMVKLILDNHAKESDIGGEALAWCQKRSEEDPAMKKKFFESIDKLISKPGAITQDVLLGLADSTILSAEKNDDLESFQSIGIMLRSKFKEKKLPKYKAPAGEFLTKGGLVKFSSINTAEDKDFWQHWGIIEKCGGSYTSAKDPNKPTATVVLSTPCTVQGIAILGPEIKEEQAGEADPNTLLVEASKDGTTWTPIETIKKIAPVNIINIQKNPVPAKQIRVTLQGKFKGKWSLDAIHVYGRRG